MDHVYRGTCRGWPGSETIQRLRITCTSSDPLVASLFAMECLRHGQAVVYLARFEQVNGLLGDVNALAHLEREVTLTLTPAEFEARYVVRELELSRAREILAQVGFLLPNSIQDYAALHHALKETQSQGSRLTPRQIAVFDRLAYE